ncbi:hypothetical protein NARC_50123 [Candidatus Nitrosocosmicus arcticus]|uniref:Uncharacterized protein n=1 Tax=Candidatus Nitrosocosmicus arcticus TaxID=2035267 RepID=A0A557SWF5_9ARCH|nr:hypothetical protein NARC_50123 [Candidatus Nitrosocosmicus arcticus]
MKSTIGGDISTVVVANKTITRDRMINILYSDLEKNMITRVFIRLIHKFISQRGPYLLHNTYLILVNYDHVLK